MLGVDALTPAIVERVWGQDDVVRNSTTTCVFD
jgi:hypothetical protein